MKIPYTSSNLAPEFMGKSITELQVEFPQAEIKEVARAQALLEAIDDKQPLIYGEGDSWFDFPGWIILNRCSDILDALLFEHKYEVHRDSDKGDTISRMTFPENMLYIQSRIRTLKPKVFLVSGGGNDLFAKDTGGAFERMLRDDTPDNPLDITVMGSELDFIVQQIRTLASLAEAEGIPSLVHGYGVTPERVLGKAAVPFVAGPWINPILRKKGYDKEQGEKILRIVVNEFNQRLEKLAKQTTLIGYVDLRDAVEKDKHWHDELHLWAPGWQKCGDAFHKAIKKLL